MRRSTSPLSLLFAGMLLFLAIGCTSQPELEATSNPQFLIGAQELASILENPEVLVLHVSADDAVYQQGHLPGARFLDLDRIAINAENVQRDVPAIDSLLDAFRAVGVNEGTRVILYDDGNGMTATRAFFALDYLGFPTMAVLDGGLAAWTSNGGAISVEPRSTQIEGTFQPIMYPGRLVSAAEVEAKRQTSLLVDARSSGEFTGETPGNTITRGGHIPGAISLDWAMHLNEDGTLKPLSDLQALYAPAQGKHTIVYCRTGMKASHSYFVSRLLGLDVSLYDGSFYDWSNQTDYPVETGAQTG